MPEPTNRDAGQGGYPAGVENAIPLVRVPPLHDSAVRRVIAAPEGCLPEADAANEARICELQREITTAIEGRHLGEARRKLKELRIRIGARSNALVEQLEAARGLR